MDKSPPQHSLPHICFEKQPLPRKAQTPFPKEVQFMCIFLESGYLGAVFSRNSWNYTSLGGEKRVDERQLSQVSTWLKDNKYFSALPTIKKPFIIMLCFPCIINLIDVTCELSTLVWNFSFLFCRLKVRRL